MSWSIAATGSKDKVTVAITAQADQQASNYGGTEEAEDIKAVKTRLLALVDALVLGDGRDVDARAWGSHSRNEQGITAAEAHVTVRGAARG